ncbi:MAG: hypothetical protein JW793_12190 [Acidobacteria bacterium]|nr:hypothetical protein [Acidobacteriota bacterium]
MHKRSSLGFFAAILCLSFPVCESGAASPQDGAVTPIELIDKHIRSIGRPETLAAIRSRGISGKAGVRFILGATGNLEMGDFMYVSEGSKTGLRMVFDDINYPGEHFTFDGSDVSVAYITPGQRSPLADFIFRHHSIMKEGLLGGVLNTAWPLLDMEKNRSGVKLTESEVEGRLLYELEYGTPGKRPGFMTVSLFFDMQSFRHLRTEYKVNIANDLTAARKILTGDDLSLSKAMDSAGDSIFIAGEPGRMTEKPTIMDSLADSKYLLVERFDNFSNVGGVILPESYSIDYSLEGQGVTFIGKWEIRAEFYTNNGTIDQSFFQASN